MAVWMASGCGDDDPPKVPLPPLASSVPAHGDTQQVRTLWISLTFAADVQDGVRDSFSLHCNGKRAKLDADPLDARTIVVNPRGELTAGAGCRLSWPSEQGDDEHIDFQVAAGEAQAVVGFDRDDTTRIAPSPDDAWLGADGVLDIPAPDRNNDSLTVLGASIGLTRVDGFSPLTAAVVELPAAPSPSALPLTTVASVDPMSTVVLVDDAGRRTPFFLVVRDEQHADGSPAHNLLVFPAERLVPGAAYTLVVSRRAYVDAGTPLAPSGFMRRALTLDAASTDNDARAREVLAPSRDVLATLSPPMRDDDIAVALRFTIRDDAGFADDMLAVYEQVQAQAPPGFDIVSVLPPSPPRPGIAAIVRGTWTAPLWSDDDYFERDAQGAPVQRGTVELDFILVLPSSAAAGTPAPVTMYQHGTPGSQEEALFVAQQLQGPDGDFAVVAFTDLLNREYDGLSFSERMFQQALAFGAFPDTPHHLALADQMAFVRMIEGLGSVDVLPRGAPDGVPDLDLAAPLTYVGISQGANHASGFLAYAPQIRAAVLIVGGGRYTGALIHQSDTVFESAVALFPALLYTELYVALQLLQSGADAQDPANHAVHVYADPHAAVEPARRASILIQEGLGDTLVPPWSTQLTAHTLGIPQLEPIWLRAATLDIADGPVTANVDPMTTAALSQFVPANHPDAPATPSCEMRGETEGHFCPQSADEAVAQRYAFLVSAVRDAVPTIAPPPVLRRAAIDPTPRPPISD